MLDLDPSEKPAMKMQEMKYAVFELKANKVYGKVCSIQANR